MQFCYSYQSILNKTVETLRFVFKTKDLNEEVINVFIMLTKAYLIQERLVVKSN